MVSVEVIISFTVFILVIAGIVYFTNIFIVHNKVQYAINSAAHEIATYTYLYQALGARGAEQTMQKDLGKYAENVDNTVTQVTDTMNEISGLYEKSGKLADDAKTVNLDTEYIAQIEADAAAVKAAGGATYESGKETVGKLQGLFEDPGGTVAGIIYMAVDGASYYVKSLGARLAAQVMTEKYLAQGSRSGDQFLKSMGVTKGYDGLDFSGSTMFCDSDYRMIDIVVEYDIHIGFLGLLLPDPNVHMIQRASVSAWVGDNGVTKHENYLKTGKGVGQGTKKAEEKEDPRGANLETKFPDEKLRSFARSYDTDKDGYLSKDEASKVDQIMLYRSGIKDFTGIEYFTEAKKIHIFDNDVGGTLDLSKNTKLQMLDVPSMNTEKLILSEESPLGQLIKSGDYTGYSYSYWGNGCKCVEISNGKSYGNPSYTYARFDKDGEAVEVGDLKYAGNLKFE